MTMKQCARCHQILSIDNFQKRKSAKDGRNYWCRKCTKEHMIGWYVKNRDRVLKRGREYGKKYRPLHCKEHRKYDKEHYKENMLYHKLHMQVWDARKKYPGYIDTIIIQRLRKDNIKRFGVLSCYLCRQPTVLGDKRLKDGLEHKVPASRGGTNDYDNLAIAHIICNRIKKDKTDVEYIKLLR